MLQRALLLSTVLADALLLAFAPADSNAQALAPAPAAQITTGAPVAPVANPCQRPRAGSVVQNPPALFSSNGVLSVRFSYQQTTDSVGRLLHCFMTPNGLQDPTLHVKPGDTLNITVTNNTPASPLGEMFNPPNCGDTTVEETDDNVGSAVNLHYHGTNVTPQCHGDNVTKTIINSGSTFQYSFTFPTDEPSGLYWYHPHIHGLAERDLLGGASGALVVDGIENTQPAVSGLRQRVLVIRDLPQLNGLAEGPGNCGVDVPFQDINVNYVPVDSHESHRGNVTFTPATLHMNHGETQFWRVSNSSSDTILDVQVVYDGVAQTLQVVGIDAVPVNSQDGTQPGHLIPVTHFRLPPAARVEFLVQAPASSVRSAQFITNNINTGPDGDCDPTRPIFNIALSSNSAADGGADDTVGTTTALSSSQQRFGATGGSSVSATRTFQFSEIQPSAFFITQVSAGQQPMVFDPNNPPAVVTTQGAMEKWIVQNIAQENHEFHMHQIHFKVLSQDNFEVNGSPQAPAINGQFLDMIEVPFWDNVKNPNGPLPQVQLLMDFRGMDIGDFVYHCHILGHEDLGMMAIIRVEPPIPGTH
jgi:FtsP/CotA-like multicopper oxidase with cupredoxin domain